MVIAIWGRDGAGKSTLADALGNLFSKYEITVIIDTDLTQPTLPVRLAGQIFKHDSSLGRAVSGIGISDVCSYLHQHPKQKRLFYAGLTDRDEYLSYEIGLESDNRAQDFIEGCRETADIVILDLSGQRTDPFVPCALIHADKIIVPVTTDVQGVCWYGAVKPLIQSMDAQGRIIPVAAMVSKYHDMKSIEKAADIHFVSALPFVKEFRQTNGTGISPLGGSTPAAMRYAKESIRLHALLKGADEA